MVVKKKAPRVEAVLLESCELKSLTTSLSVDGDDDSKELAQVLKECLTSTDPVQQVQLVSKAGSMLEHVTKAESSPDLLLLTCLDTLAVIYTTRLRAKNPLRRAVASALGNVPDWLQEKAVCCLSERLSSSLSSQSSEHYTHLTDCITSCLDSFPIGEKCIHHLITEVLQFFQKVVSEYLEQNRSLAGRHVAQAQLMQSCLAVVKASMLVVQRSQELISAAQLEASSSSALQQAFSGLLQCYTQILTEEEFVQAVQSTAGMAVVLLIKSVLGNGDTLSVMVAGLLQCIQQEGDTAPLWLKQSCAGLYVSTRPAALALYLSHGALAMLNWRGRTLGLQDEKLLLLVPDVILSLDARVKESSTAMVVSRVLSLWSSAVFDCLQAEPKPSLLCQSLYGECQLPTRLLRHVYAHWEHPLDGVRHQSRILFRNLLLAHQRCGALDSDPTHDAYIIQLTHSLLALDWHMKGKYGSLACLAEHLGAEYLLKLDASLPSRLLALMGDQTLATYSSELLEKLFVSHKSQLCARFRDDGWMDDWHKTWVIPLLKVLCTVKLEQTTYILDYFLPKLLRCNPASLRCMVQALQDMPFRSDGSVGSRGALGALMTCLRAARAQGVLKPVDEHLWGTMVPLPLLKQALVHKHDQVRVDALGLVCESHRSTETLSTQEMDLIRHFLPSNLNSQSPGVRQQTVSLFKKLLCRMKESTQSLQKKLAQEKDELQKKRDQHILSTYQEFLCWFCESLFQVLQPGASFSRCLVTLQLLGLVADHFSFSMDPESFALGACVTVQHAQAVLYCLSNNFLEVKQLACTLLQKLPSKAVGLQEPERLHCVLQAALDLSTSTKPFDSVTAAHLLNLLLHQEALQQALLRCAQEKSVSLQLPDFIQPSDVSILEKNTLAVVLFLLTCLKAEVAEAETSLLVASASCPLYGRAHCITAALQQLSTGSLQLQAEWNRLVSDLIALCYRMSDVVSPVVQSSSPEGLIPMDTDTETSSGLQKILQEIQPRDTNNFFNSPRELDTTSEEQLNTPQPTSNGSEGEAYRVTAQMVLVCCWRSMKEVSMLLGELCQRMPLRTHTYRGLITEEQVEGVGRYFREQLLQSRHRGAFELAYVGFVRLTEMLCRSGSTTLQQLPAKWLKEVLMEVKGSDPSSKLCATRRSAGIPFYIQALLSSEPKSSSCSLLKMTMRELTALAMPSHDGATDRSTVPQVHALNILRALYRDTRLGENIVPFVAEGLQAAVLGFTSPVWAVRNSSTLLFSTLITRIFGVKRGKDEHSKKNKMTGWEFFTRFPALYPFLLSQLKEAASSVDSDAGQVKLHPSLFLLLLVLGRLYPSPMDGSCSPLSLASFRPFILRCSRSAVYRTREMAARALVPFVLVTDVPATIRTLLEDLPEKAGPGTQQNHIHGTLLQVLFLLRSYLADAHRPQTQGVDQDSDFIRSLRLRVWLATRQNPCLVTRGTMLDVLSDLCTSHSAPVEDSQLKKLRTETLYILMDSELVAPRSLDEVHLSGPGAMQYLQSLAHLATSIAMDSSTLWSTQEAERQLKDVLSHLLQCSHYEVRQLALERLLERLQTKEEHQPLPFDLNVSTLTYLALHEPHPTCLAKVLQLLSVLPLSSILPWQDNSTSLSDDKALGHLLSVAETSTHSLELHCAALSLASRLVVHLAKKTPLEGVAVSHGTRWVALVTQDCSEEQPVEVKQTAAEVLVKVTPTLLTSDTLPMGVTHTLALWQSLFTLLQDEDQDVRNKAADFICYLPAHLITTGVAQGAVSPPVALQMGVEILCQLFQVWDQVAVGIMTLTEWMLGDNQSELGNEKTFDLDEEFLFEKREMNLWAEPLQWATLLHRHLCALLTVPSSLSLCPAELDRFSTIAGANADSARRALSSLPALPQFSATIEYAKMTLLNERATLTQNVLATIRQNISS
ncbi:thyroid adenoma-associated protein isoform X1 [Tachysurus fulvidraco]|uniref:thyroid adenoma-associated protein isoform X1 n=1 Tax=Tachysurus fulvidraco TaxID=1234273 RepID=UPI001FEF0EEE|nr:thyroid adenoma-associated protein isoform X1 [Tachysurus fulvidraco]XP_047667880.1 thyroid adenoma-associated protein isoform X1 [Tachysurus fulvidraco]XP_047667881.1 thyroid adenoma-associated protein isoform X1 [Tachysurus fulvidraco]